MRGECTLVVSSHNLAEIQDLCSEIALLHQGRVLKQDKIDAFQNAAADYRSSPGAINPPTGAPPAPVDLFAGRTTGFGDLFYA